MNILVIGRAFPEEKTGMMGIFELEQATALNNLGHEVKYFFCDTRSIKYLRKYGYKYIIKNGVAAYGYHLPIGGAPQKVFDRIKKHYYEKGLQKVLVKEWMPDIIHVHFPLLTLNDYIWDLLKGFEKPIVVTEHWSKVQTRELSSRYLNLLNRIVNEADEFICVGDALKESVIELTKTVRDIRIVPNMVSSLFNYQNEQNTKKKHFEFITVGRLIEIKRFDWVIEAFVKAFPNNMYVHLKIVGDGPLFSRLKRKIDDLNMNERIIMTGFLSREETANLMKKSDAFVSASALETFGVPFIEAMACGKPVVGAKGGSIDKYINETNGIFFESDNLNDLVRALKQVYANRNLYDSKLIAETATKYFSEEAIAKQLDSIFRDCIKKYAK